MNITKQKKSNIYIYKEKITNWQRGRVGGRREEGMEDKEVQTFIYKINESQLWNVQYGEYSQ